MTQFSREELIAEAQRRGLQIPQQTPKFSREELVAEARRRGLSIPQPATQGPMPADVPFGDLDKFVGQPAQQPDRSMGDRLLGAGETALSAATGATGGALGMIGGTAYGLGKELVSGEFGSPEAANRIEQMGMQGAHMGTYEPRTEAGQEYTRDLGQMMGPMQALGPGINLPGGAGAAPRLRQILSRTPKKASEADLVKAIKKGGRKAQAALQDIANPDSEVLASAQRLGVEDYLQADHVSSNQQFRDIAQLAKSIPGSELKALEEEGLLNVARRAENLVREMGATDDLASMADEVKTRLGSVQSRLDEISENYFSKVNEGIGNRTPVKADNVLSFLRERAEDLGGEKNLSAAERKLIRTLTHTKDYTPTYAVLDNSRKEIGQAMKNRGVFKDVQEGLRKQLYKNLIKDQMLAAEAKGQRTNLYLANKSVRLRKGVEDDLTALFGKQLDRSFVTPLKTAYKRIPAGDIDSLEKIIKSAPESMRPQIVAGGLASALGKLNKSGEVSFNEYAQWYQNSSRNRASFNKLLKYLPQGSEQKLKDLYNVANGIRMAQKKYTPTGRGEMRMRAALEEADGLIGRVMSGAGKFGAAVGLESQLPGSGFLYAAKEIVKGLGNKEPRSALDNLLSSTQFRRVLNERVAKGENTKGSISDLANSKAFKNYINTYGVDVGLSPEVWLLESMSLDRDLE